MSQTPLNTRKVPFNEIGSLVAQVVDAKAMGIVNSKDRTQLNGRRNAEGDDQNYMVKVTETYNIESKVTEEETVQITLVRVTNTQTTELQTGTESYVATAEALEIERLTDLPGNIVITNVEGNEYRLLSEDVVVQDWISSELESIEFIFDELLTDIKLESRSLNASVSFIAFEGFTYTIKQGETIIYEDLEDNDEADNNEALGNITLSGLTEGLTYDVTYEGYQVIETITQDEVEGQVDKLYVLYEYTFISFVPLNVNDRPQDKDLELDYDGVPLYDKQGYFSDSTRQSFVVDNNTGLIYKIENINIASLSGGCVTIQDNPFPFDMRLSENKELEFYSLHQNASIETYSCIKDKFSNIFIRNNRLNLFNSINNSTFYVINGYNQPDDSPYAREISYWLTNKGQVVTFPEPNRNNIRFLNLEYARIFHGLNESQPIDITNDLIIYQDFQNNQLDRTFRIKDGFSYSYQTNLLEEWIRFPGSGFRHQFWGAIFSLEINQEIEWRRDTTIFNTQFLEKNDLLLEFTEDGKVIAYPNFYDNLKNSQFQNGGVLYNLESYVVIEDVIYEKSGDWWNGSFVRYDLNGKKTYELIAERDDNNELIINSYLAGTYVASTTTTITLQPINR
jgi:hypothetical protein